MKTLQKIYLHQKKYIAAMLSICLGISVLYACGINDSKVKGYSISGTLSGTGVSGAKLTLESVGASVSVNRLLTIESNSTSYLFSDLPPGQYRLTSQSSNSSYGADPLEITIIDASLVRNIRFELSSFTVTGRIVRGDPWMPINAAITLRASNGQEISGRHNGAGDYTISNVPSGNYTLTISPSRFKSNSLTRVINESVAPNGTVTIPDFLLEENPATPMYYYIATELRDNNLESPLSVLQTLGSQSNQNGVWVSTLISWGGNNELWEIRRLPGRAAYRFVHRETGRFLDFDPNNITSSNSEGKVHIWESVPGGIDANNQIFTINRIGSSSPAVYQIQGTRPFNGVNRVLLRNSGLGKHVGINSSLHNRDRDVFYLAPHFTR